jgi:hypothetical protein
MMPKHNAAIQAATRREHSLHVRKVESKKLYQRNRERLTKRVLID